MTMPSETPVKTPLELAFTIERASQLQPVGSPCTDVCRLDKTTGYCEGCFRSREEIKAWKTLPDADKLSLFPALLDRKAAA
ncbi:DUF1289 domain-containing protein [Burkholderia sp. Leaf177]|uniref:DUF1289 domain-containing protein n=1 Tax=Burkholderia sp. Leaf177 TaxID=1736287 RepID=UPI000ABC0DCE|nr:DUF1289 domain-containing protein [Burkholderia sp. Leaf177]